MQEPTEFSLSEQAEQAIADYQAYLTQAANLKPLTAATYLRIVSDFLYWHEALSRQPFTPGDVSQAHIQRYADHQARALKRKPATIRRNLQAISHYFKWLAASGTITENPVRGVGRERRKRGEARYDMQVTVRMTTPMWANLRRLAGEESQMPRLAREAIRDYLDNQADLAGSRRNFTGQFKQRVEEMERLAGWQMTLLVVLLAEIGSVLITRLIPMPPEEQHQYSPGALLKSAYATTIERGWVVRNTLLRTANEAELTQSRERG